MSENISNTPLDTEITTLKKSVLKNIDAYMENLINQVIEWGKIKAKQAKAAEEDITVEELYRRNSFGVPTSCEINSIIQDCVFKCIEIGIKEGVKEYDKEFEYGMELARKKIFANYMTSYFRNPQQSLHQAIQTCKQILPEWDDNKFKEELTSLQKKLNIKLNLDSIFLNEYIKDKIKNKDFENAYKLYCDDESISSSNKPIDFMKEVVQEHGIDTKILNDAAEAITDYMGEITAFKAKLLQDIMNTDEYQNIFYSNGGEKQKQGANLFGAGEDPNAL